MSELKALASRGGGGGAGEDSERVLGTGDPPARDRSGGGRSAGPNPQLRGEWGYSFGSGLGFGCRTDLITCLSAHPVPPGQLFLCLGPSSLPAQAPKCHRC